MSLRFSAAPKCARCDTSVFANEQLKATGKVFHKACFNCCTCGKRIEYGMQNESDCDIWSVRCGGCLTVAIN